MLSLPPGPTTNTCMVVEVSLSLSLSLSLALTHSHLLSHSLSPSLPGPLSGSGACNHTSAKTRARTQHHVSKNKIPAWERDTTRTSPLSFYPPPCTPHGRESKHDQERLTVEGQMDANHGHAHGHVDLLMCVTGGYRVSRNRSQKKKHKKTT